MSILDKASLIQIPSGYKSTKLYSLRPSNGTGDFTFARSSSATRVNSEGLIETMSANVPRLDYSGGASCASLLLEPQRTNVVTYSEDFSQTFWKKGAGLAITLNNAVSPDGSQTATKVQKTSQDYLFLRAFFATAIVGTLSVFVKKGNYRYVGIRNNETAGTAHSVFDFDTETFVTTASNHSLSFVKHENGWYRLIDYVSVDDNSNYQGIAITDVLGNEISTDIPLNSYVYVWGAQYEQNQSYPTSYIPTSGSTATRTADVCNNAGTSATFNDSEGVLFAEIAQDNNSFNTISISDGGTSDRVTVAYQNNNIKSILVHNNNVVQLENSGYPQNSFHKVAIKYTQSNVSLIINGFKLSTASRGAFADSLNTLQFAQGNGGNNFYGKCKQLMYFDEALSDEELSDLTGQVNLSFNNLATFYGYTIL